MEPSRPRVLVTGRARTTALEPVTPNTVKIRNLSHHHDQDAFVADEMADDDGSGFQVCHHCRIEDEVADEGGVDSLFPTLERNLLKRGLPLEFRIITIVVIILRQ